MRTSALCAVAGLAALSLAVTGCSGGSKSAAGAAPAGAASAVAAAGSSATSAAKAAAAGGSGGSGGGSGSVNVCSLMTSAQASSINHVTYGAATPKSPTSGYDTCTYKNTGKHDSPVDIQDLTVTVIGISGCWSGLQQADGPGKSISGLGDAAFGAQIGVDIKAGDRCVEISGLTSDELFGHYDRDVAMAKIVLSHLH
jgi:hypothetical protein